MKKTLLLLALPFMVTGMLQAQNYVLNDFEGGDEWEDWGGLTREIVANPEDGGINTSANALKVVTSGEWKAIKKYYEELLPSPYHSKITLDVWVEQSSQIALYLDNSQSEQNDGDVAYISVTDLNQWVKLEFDISAFTNSDYKQIAFKIETAGTYYFDNITLVDGDGTTDLNYGDFEVGTKSAWAINGNGTVVIDDNPSLEGNTSAKALKFTPTEEWKSIKRVSLASFFNANYKAFAVDVYPAEAGQVEIAFANSIGGAEPKKVYFDVVENAWQKLKVKLDELPAKDYKAITVKYAKNAVIYFDNFVASADVSVGINDNTTLAYQVSVYPNPAVDVVNINSINAVSKVNVVNIVGQTVLTTSGNKVDVSNLPAGQYILILEDSEGEVKNLKFFKK